MMKAKIALCVAVLVAASGAAYGTAYTFSGLRFSDLPSGETVAGALWDNTLNWTPGLTLPGTSSDSYYIQKDGAGNLLTTASRIYMPNPGSTSSTRYFGSVNVDCGVLVIPKAFAGTYRFMSDSGQTGSLVITADCAAMTTTGGRGSTGNPKNFVMDGDFILDSKFQKTIYGSWGPESGNVNAGYNKLVVTMEPNFVSSRTSTYRFASAQVAMDDAVCKVTLDNSAKVNFVPTTNGASNWMMLLTINNGTASLPTTAGGSVNILWGTGSSSTPNGQVVVGARNVDTSQLNVNIQPYPGFTAGGSSLFSTVGGRKRALGQLLSAGAYRDVEFTRINTNGNDCADITGFFAGPVHLRNFFVGVNHDSVNNASAGAETLYILDADNSLTGAAVGASNLTIDQNFTLGPTNAARGSTAVFKAKASQIKVGGNVDVRYNTVSASTPKGSWILGGTSTWNVGGNFTVECGTLSGLNWNMGTSTLICDGNGTSKAQSLATKGLPFYNVTLNNPGGAVTLADNILLKGNFRLQNGVFRTGTKYLVFQGGQGTVDTAETLQVDNATGALGSVAIKQGSPTWVKLMSDLTVTDNLDIDAGCELLLNGHTLTVLGVEEQRYTGRTTFSGAGSWQVSEGGLIVGSSSAVPEPATLLLLGSGVLGAIGLIRRRREQ